MSEKDGLFENPNQNEEQNIEIQKRDTLLEIKEDTSSILDVLNNFGGRQIDLLAQAEKQAKARHLSDRRTNNELVRALKMPKTTEKVRSENKAKPPQLPAGEKTNNIKEKAQNTVSKPAPEKDKNKPVSEEMLPNSWKRDKDGRVRDQKGRYVKEDELAKHGIKNPQKESKNSEEETEDLARENALLDALKDVKDAVESPDNLDPLIDGVKEVTAPLGAAFDIGKTVVGTAGRGFGKLFNSQNKEQRTRDKFFNQFKKFTKSQEKAENQQTSWLKRIWKKPNGEGLFGRLFGGLMGLARLPFFFARMPFMFAMVLGRLLLKALGGVGKMGMGALGGLGKLGKGFIKRIPILGALFALGDGIGGLFDDTRDENGKSNRGKRVGSAVGTAIGGVAGSFFGPVGTIAGAMIGDWIGEKIGTWAADFDWSIIGKKITGAWDGAVGWVKETWNSISWDSFTTAISNGWNTATDWIKNQWANFDWGDFTTKVSAAWDTVSDWIKTTWDNIDWKSFGDKVSKLWDGVSNWIKETWDNIDFSGAWETTKEVAVKIKDKGVELTNKAIDGAKNAATTAKNWVTDKATSAYDSVGNWFSGMIDIANMQLATENDTVTKETLDNIEEAEKTQIINDADNYSILEKIKNILGDTLLLWREWVANFYGNEMNRGEISNGHPSTLGTQGSLSDISGVSMISGGAVDPKTGKPLRYTNAEFKGSNIDGLSKEETALAMNALSARESSSNFQAENQFGYIGGYQFGGEALADLGYVNKQKWQLFRAATKGKNIYSGGQGNSLHAQFLNDPSNWNIAGGKQAYLNSKQLQDESAVKLMNKNLQFLKGKGVQLNNVGDIVGAGFASHLKGAGNALKLFKNGTDSRDANGTSTSYYAQLGRNAMADSKALSVVSAKIAETSQGISVPQAKSIAGMNIPPITPPKDTTREIIRQVEQESAKKSTTIQSAVQPVSQTASTPDYGLQFLTQDVSDRRIAHIVTGGIAQKGRM